MKSFRQIIEHCLSTHGDWQLLLIFFSMKAINQGKSREWFGEPVEGATRVKLLSKGAIEVGPELKFEHVAFDADVLEPDWQGVAVMPVLNADTEEEVQRGFAEMVGHMKHNPRAIPLYNKQGGVIDVDLSLAEPSSKVTAH